MIKKKKKTRKEFGIHVVCYELRNMINLNLCTQFKEQRRNKPKTLKK